MSDRFFYDGLLQPGEVTLRGDEAHHLAQVRRLSPGQAVTLFNGDGLSHPAVIQEVTRRDVLLLVGEPLEAGRERPQPCWIASALPKGDRFDFLLEKLTELGVTDFIPLMTERSVVVPREEKRDKWTRAVIEASKQCGRDRLMQVHPPQRFKELLQRGGLPPVRRLAHPGGERLGFLHASATVHAIGPEGGFSDSEVEEARAAGWQVGALGPRILRVESAALVAACLTL